MKYKLYTLDNEFIKETDNRATNFTGIVEYCRHSKLIWKAWYVNDKLHRLDGPAVEWNDGIKYWYIDSKQVTKEEHKLLYSIMRLKGLL